MSGVTDSRKHRDESDPCTTRNEPGNYHFELKCEDCDVWRMSSASLDKVDDLYRQGRVTQDDFEAFDYVFTLLSPYQGTPVEPTDPHVRRIARKLLVARAFDVPATLLD
jgi:hypothetical protein